MRYSLTLMRLMIVVCLGLQLGPGLPGRATAQEPMVRDALIFQPSGAYSKLQMIESTSRVIQSRGKILRVDGFDPAVVKVNSIPNIANQIRVQAAAAGVTSVVILDEFNETFTVDISVIGDVRQLEALIRKAFPDASIHATKVKDSVLLQGWVNEQRQLTPIIEMAEQFHPKVLNYIQIGGVQQVMLRVKIMEVQRAKIRKMGFNFLHIDEHGYLNSVPGGLGPLNLQQSPVTLPFGGPPSIAVDKAAFAASTATFGITAGDFIFQGFIEALKQEKLLKVLAEPELVTTNGRPANFISGGEFPIPIPQSLGTVTIQFKQFGVQLEFVPYVLGGGRLRMDVAPEVSEQDYTGAITLNGTTVPGLSVRRVNTQVEMNFGQTLVIGGLLFNRVTAQTSKVPLLGELPWIGTAFSRKSYDESETELLIMVTPELVSAMDANQVPANGPGQNSVSPTDRELFFNGQIELPKSAGEECEGCGVGGVPSSPPGVVAGGSPRGGMSPYPTPASQNSVSPYPTDAEPLPSPRAGDSPARQPSLELPPVEAVPDSARAGRNNSGVRNASAEVPAGRRSRPGLIAPTSGTLPAPPARGQERPRMISP